MTRPSLRHLGPLAACLLPLAARAADPQPYAVDLEKTGDKSLDAALGDSANLVTLRDKAPAGPFALIGRAQADVARLRTALESFGYYDGAIAIAIDGRPLDDPALPDRLRAHPAAPPVPITVRVRRGPLFHLRHVRVQGADPAAREALKVHPGDAAAAAPVLAGEGQLVEASQEEGHAYARLARLTVTEDKPARVLDVTYALEAGPRLDIGPIALRGLGSVDEGFVRRHLQLRPGQLYQPSTLDAARSDLAGIGVFSSVRVGKADQPDASGRVPITVELTEAKRHVVGFTAAYSTDLGASLGATWSHRNLFGGAEQLNLRAAAINLGGNATDGFGYDFDAQLIKPDLWRRDQTLTANLEAIRQSLQAYDQTAALASAIVSRKLGPHWSGSLGVQGEQESITQEGAATDYTLVGLPVGARYDTTTSLLAPTSGVRLALQGTPTASLTGSGGTFAVLRASGSTYLDLAGDRRSILALRATAATVQGASTLAIPPDQRLYAGGSDTVRGYKYQSVGPQFPDHNPVGGTQLAAATAELRQRLWGSFGMAAFVDAGQVTGERASVRGVRGPDTGGRLAIGAGVGARYATPIGPIRLDVAVPLVRFPGGDDFEFYIGIGEAF